MLSTMNNSKIQEMYLFIEISFEQLFNIFPQRLTFIQTQNAELSYIELCFADHTSKPVFFLPLTRKLRRKYRYKLTDTATKTGTDA